MPVLAKVGMVFCPRTVVSNQDNVGGIVSAEELGKSGSVQKKGGEMLTALQRMDI